MTAKSRSNTAIDDENLNNQTKSFPHNDGRIPPQDINAEKSLLGAILLDDTSLTRH